MSTADERRGFLLAYDRELRGDPEVRSCERVVRHGPLYWARFPRGGFVTYRSLDGHDAAGLVARTVRHFEECTHVTSFEWKSRSHDLPSTLPELLSAHGLVADEPETVMIGDAESVVAAGTDPRGGHRAPGR